MNHVAGYCVVNDVSEREFQIERAGTWDKGKGCDTFGPIGPWLVTRDEIANPQDLDLWLEVDGHRYQDGSHQDDGLRGAASGQLCEPVHEPAARRRDLHRHAPRRRHGPKKPQTYLKGGETIELGIKGLGQQRQTVDRA